MGAALQTAGAAELAAELTCCACSSVCGLVTRDSATRAKFRYISFLLIATVTSVILLIPGLRVKLDKIPHLCTGLVSRDTCDKLVGFGAVYRLLLAVTLFHLLLSVLTIRVTRVSSYRAKFNNGLWFFKMGLLIGLTVAALYIPRRTFFFRIWMYLSLSGGFIFVIFQIILIIDFGHSWSLSWAERLEAGNTKFWYVSMAFATIVMFSISIAAMLGFYMFFTTIPNLRKCRANMFYISFVATQCFTATIVSVAPAVQKELAGAGLLQSSVVVLYTSYLSWNTLSSEPDATCNPLGHIIMTYDSFTGISGEGVLGSLLTLILLFFACTVRAHTSHLGKFGLALAESEAFALEIYNQDKQKYQVEKNLETGRTEVALNEYVGYNYSFFHIIMSLASSHILMVITNWHSPDDSLDMQKLVKNWASVWVQMASSFICILLYLWFLVTPLVKKVWGPVFGIFDEERQNQDSQQKEVPRGGPNSGNVCQKHQDTTSVTTERLHSSPKRRSNIFASHSRAGHYSDVDDAFSRRPESRGLSRGDELTREKPTKFRSNNILDESSVSIWSAASRAVRRKLARRESEAPREDESFSSAKGQVTKNKHHTPKHELERTKLVPTKQNERFAGEDREQGGPSSKAGPLRLNRPAQQPLKDPAGLARETPTTSMRSAERFETPVEVTGYRQQSRDTNSCDPLKIDKFAQGGDITLKRTNSPGVTEHSNDVGRGFSTQIQSIDKDYVNSSPESPRVLSSLSSRVQSPETAREILTLQWKILRAQAKVVKIQERVIRLQAESAAASEHMLGQTALADSNANQRPRAHKEPG